MQRTTAFNGLPEERMTQAAKTPANNEKIIRLVSIASNTAIKGGRTLQDP